MVEVSCFCLGSTVLTESYLVSLSANCLTPVPLFLQTMTFVSFITHLNAS